MERKTPSSTISVPVSLVDHLAQVGQALLEVATELKKQAEATTHQELEGRARDQAWFWTKEWQSHEKEVDEELARGDFKDFDSVDELLNDLHAHS